MDLALLALLILTFVSRLPFLLQAGNLMDFDEATFALMAKRILEGEFPIYISGHSYSGSLISFLMAPFIAVLGPTPLAARLTSFSWFMVFIFIFYHALKRIFSKPTAIFACLFMIMAPAGILDISTRIWGGHAELWPFMAGILFLLSYYFDSPENPAQKKLSILFFAGLIAGIAIWINVLFVLFFLPIAVFFGLRAWPPRSQSLAAGFWNAFLLKNSGLPGWVRFPVMSFHFFLIVFFVCQFLNLFQIHLFPGLDAVVRFFDTDPPFRMKELKRIFFTLCGEIAVISILNSRKDLPVLWHKVRCLLLSVLGFIIGYLPALVFNLCDGEGLRLFHKSGILAPQFMIERVREIFTESLPIFFMSLQYSPFRGQGFWEASVKTIGWGLILFALAAVIIQRRRDFTLFTKRGSETVSYIPVFFMMILLTIAANLASTLEAVRYLVPAYVGLTVIFGFFFGNILWSKYKTAALLTVFMIFGHFAVSAYEYYDEIPKDEESHLEEILHYVENENVFGGMGPREVVHLLTYLSGERIVFSTYGQEERYKPHADYTQSLDRRAYVFEAGDSAAQAFRANPNLMARVTETEDFGPYLVYITDRGPDNSPDKPYTLWRQHQGPHLYFNR